MKKIILHSIFTVLIFLLFLSFYTVALSENRVQYPLDDWNGEWKQYTYGGNIRSMAAIGDEMWIGTEGGLVVLDQATGHTTLYNTLNSALPRNDIRAIAADKDGAVWIGTGNGLMRMDDTGETVYTPENSELPGYAIEMIKTDANGIVWVGARSPTVGLVKIDGDEWDVFTTDNSGLPSSHYISAIAIDDENSKWIATHGGGLARFDGTDWEVYHRLNSPLQSDFVRAVEIDGSGNVWVAEWERLLKYDGSTWELYISEDSDLPDPLPHVVTIDGKDNLWIGTSFGLAKYDGHEWTALDADQSLIYYSGINTIVIDDYGSKWIGTAESLVKYDDQDWMSYETSFSGLPDNNIHGLTVDGGGRTWMATSGGLVRFNGMDWFVYDHENSDLPDFSVSSVAFDRDGNKWVGALGLLKYDGVAWTHYTSDNSGLPANNISSITIDNENSIWAGTYSSGLVKYDGQAWTVYDTTNSDIPGDNIRAVAIDDSGHVWVGMWHGGLAEFNGTDWFIHEITLRHGFISPRVYSIAFDLSGDMWVTTENELVRYDGTECTAYDFRSPGISDRGRPVAIDRSENKWVGTQGGGLAVLDDSGEWTVYDTRNSGLPGNTIISLAVDESDNIWIGTTAGLAVFNKEAITIRSVTLTSPLAGEKWEPGTEQYITWVSNGIDMVKLEFSSDNGDTWETVADSISAAPGSYSFLTPDSPSDECLIRISEVDGELIDISNGVFSIQKTTSVDEDAVPFEYSLEQNYPNPFNPETQIRFTLKERTNVLVEVYDILGRRVATIVDEMRSGGVHTVTWNGINQRGQTVGSGVYLYRIEAGNFVKTKRMMFIK